MHTHTQQTAQIISPAALKRGGNLHTGTDTLWLSFYGCYNTAAADRQCAELRGEKKRGGKCIMVLLLYNKNNNK